MSAFRRHPGFPIQPYQNVRAALIKYGRVKENVPGMPIWTVMLFTEKGVVFPNF